MVDVGGNSGEFSLQICRRHPNLHATVMDLPMVCEVGMEHILAEPERDQISFRKGDVRSDPLPSGADLITFKSMLHDWPDDAALHFLRKASDTLEPGGTLLIFERGPLQIAASEAAAATLPFSMLPDLLFFRSYREPAIYREQLASLGLTQIEIQPIPLEMPFYLVTARK